MVKVGDKLTVRVLEVDLQRKRISLSAKRGKAATAAAKPDAPNTASGAGTKAAGAKGPGVASRRPSGRPPERGPGGPGGSGGSGGRDGNRGARPERAPERFQNNPFADLLKKT